MGIEFHQLTAIQVNKGDFFSIGLTAKVILFLFAVILVSGCGDDNKSDNPAIEKDTLVQFLEYTLNDTVFSYMENDTIIFHPSRTIEYSNNDSSYLLYKSLLTVAIEYKLQYGTSFKLRNIEFFAKIRKDQMCQISLRHTLNPGVIESMFGKGDMSFANQYCYDSFNSNTVVGLNFPFYNSDCKSYYSYPIRCLESGENNFCKQDNSYFKINSAVRYNHKQFGECIVLNGEFKANLYNDPVATTDDKMVLENGRFQIAITDNNIPFRY